MTRLAIVVSEFNSEITFKMLERARNHADEVGAKVSYVLYVPGTFDMPLAVERLLKKKNVDAVVTLGVACEVPEAVFCPFSTSMAGSAPEKAIMPPAAPVLPAENVQS